MPTCLPACVHRDRARWSDAAETQASELSLVARVPHDKRGDDRLGLFCGVSKHMGKHLLRASTNTQMSTLELRLGRQTRNSLSISLFHLTPKLETQTLSSLRSNSTGVVLILMLLLLPAKESAAHVASQMTHSQWSGCVQKTLVCGFRLCVM